MSILKQDIEIAMSKLLAYLETRPEYANCQINTGTLKYYKQRSSFGEYRKVAKEYLNIKTMQFPNTDIEHDGFYIYIGFVNKDVINRDYPSLTYSDDWKNASDALGIYGIARANGLSDKNNVEPFCWYKAN